jgi:hypothetical protein
MRPTHSSRRINRAIRPAGVIAFTSRHARLAGLLTLVMVAGFAASARALSPAAVGPAATSHPASTLQDGSALPLTAQAAVSRAPAADHRPFRIRRTASGAIIVSDPTHGLRATLIAGRITVRDAHGLRVALSGPAIGRGTTLTPVRGFAAPALSNNRVTFASPSTDEWYAKSRSGIEQGFAIPHRPAGCGALKISQTLAGNSEAHVQPGGQDVRFGSHTTGLRYGQLVVRDAAGTRMRASMSISNHHLTITINDAQTVYPLRVDPTAYTVAKQVPYTEILHALDSESAARMRRLAQAGKGSSCRFRSRSGWRS